LSVNKSCRKEIKLNYFYYCAMFHKQKTEDTHRIKHGMRI